MDQRTLRIATAIVVGIGGLAGAARAEFTKPWDALVEIDGAPSWIGRGMTMYTINAGTYRVGFDDAKPKNNDAAAGLNSLLFAYGGSDSGRLAGPLADSFEIVNVGDNNTYTDLLLLIAIDADAAKLAGAGLSLSIGARGGPTHQLDAGGFVFYDPAALGYATGRPSGFYSITEPSAEPISYDFSRGMVSVVALTGLAVGPLGGSATVDYAFEGLPGKAVFSVYGKISDLERVKHTNRAILDVNNPNKPVSTFEVVPEPAAAALLGVAAGALLRRRRR